MGPLPGYQFRRLLRAMDAEAFERFVADAWRARGWTVEREAGFLVVEHPDLGNRRTLDVRSMPWWRPGTPSPAPSDADLVIVDRPVPGEHPSVVDADDLHDLVRYAVDDEGRAGLFDDHLAESGSLSGWAVRRVPRGPDVGPALVVVALAVVLAAGAGVAFLPAEQPAAGVREPTETATPVEPVGDTGTPSEFAVTQWPGGGGGYPPGVDADGITDAAALAATHVERAGQRPYELDLAVRAFEDGRAVAVYEERIAVRSDWTFVSSVESEGDLDGDHPAFSAVELYSAGNGVFVHVDPDRSVDRQTALRASPGDVAGLENRVERYLLGALSGNDSSVVETRQVGDTTLHRVNVTHTTPDGDAESASVLVTAGGTVHSVRVERDVSGTDRSLIVSLRYTYGPVIVDPPAWVGNASVTAGRNLPLSKR
mgnify:CR=1 FL=1